MIVNRSETNKYCYTSIVEINGKNSEMKLDFGILKLQTGTTYRCNLSLERAFLLITGEISFIWDNQEYIARRNSCFDENPITLHVAQSVEVVIYAIEDSEICIERCVNNKNFKSKLYLMEDNKTNIFGKDVLNNTSKRVVRTVFDGEIAPESNMVIGEVINYPGRWSSYPPHHHPQPEIYYYKMLPSQGFGVSILNDDAFVVRDGDSSLIKPNKTHSQVAAPGYAMYYIWMIPHLDNDRWLPTTRYYNEEHKWLLDPDVKIWPEISR